jgi:hypothetical protein
MIKLLNRIIKNKKEHREEIGEVKDLLKDATTTFAANLPANIQENRKTLFDVIAQYHRGELSKEAVRPTLKAGFILLSCATKDEQEDLLRTCIDVDLDINKNSNFTNDEFDTYEKIISYIHRNRQEKIKVLLKKAAQKINTQELSISKETIDFITSITDEKLEILKEMLRYVVGNGILEYENITKDFIDKGFTQSGSDNIKFLGRVFFNQDPVGGKSYPTKLEAVDIEGILIWKSSIMLINLSGVGFTEETLRTYLSIEENKNNFKKFLGSFKHPVLTKETVKIITKQPAKAGIVDFNIKCFTILTEVGVEMYSLLKDEIGDCPNDYLQSVVEDKQYKNFGLTYEIIKTT